MLFPEPFSNGFQTLGQSYFHSDICTEGDDPEAEIEAPARGVSLEFPQETTDRIPEAEIEAPAPGVSLEFTQETTDRIPGKKIDPPQILGFKKGVFRVKFNRLSRRHGDL